MSSASPRCADRVAFVAALAAAWARLRRHAGGRAAGRDRARQLPEPRRPHRQRRRPRHAGAAPCACSPRCATAGYRIDDCPHDGAALMEVLLGGVDQRTRDRVPAAVARSRLPVDEYAAFFERLPQACSDASSDRWGAPSATRFVDGAFGLAILPLGNVAVGDPAGARLQYRPERDLSRPGPGAAARLSRLLCLAGQTVRRPRGRPSRQARQPGMAARQGAGAVGRLLAGSGARPAAAPLSVHRQRSRRGHAGQAARAPRSSSTI